MRRVKTRPLHSKSSLERPRRSQAPAMSRSQQDTSSETVPVPCTSLAGRDALRRGHVHGAGVVLVGSMESEKERGRSKSFYLALGVMVRPVSDTLPTVYVLVTMSRPIVLRSFWGMRTSMTTSSSSSSSAPGLTSFVCVP